MSATMVKATKVFAKHNSCDLRHLTFIFYETRSSFSEFVVERELVQWALNSIKAKIKISAAAMALLVAASVPHRGDLGDFGDSDDEQLEFVMSGLLNLLIALCISRLSSP